MADIASGEVWMRMNKYGGDCLHQNKVLSSEKPDQKRFVITFFRLAIYYAFMSQYDVRGQLSSGGPDTIWQASYYESQPS